MRTGKRHPMRVRKRLCVSVSGGKQSIYFSKSKTYFGVLGVFVKGIVILNIVFGFVVLNSIWRHGLNYVSTCFRNIPKNVPEVWTIFVRNIWGDSFGIVGPLTNIEILGFYFRILGFCFRLRTARKSDIAINNLSRFVPNCEISRMIT